MPAYKDEKKKTWTSKFSYKDWMGNTKWACKRGFKTKREAVEYENNFKMELAGDLDMAFESFVEKYKSEVFPRIKQSTRMTKANIIEHHIVPYFSKKKLNEITNKDVIQWQNALIKYTNPRSGKPFTKSYLKTVHNQLSALLNYAVKHYGLKENVAQKVGNMGSEKDIKMKFWTHEEYTKFREAAMNNPLMYYCFEVLYWTGIREGELLALTLEDVDFTNNTISIDKTYHVLEGKELITTPKTEKSNRTIVIPEFLTEELEDYVAMVYKMESTDRLFPTNKTSLNKYLKVFAAAADVKPIRVHDLRHSHVSLLINLGYSAVAIADRMGHESIEITYKYSHLFPSVQNDMADSLNTLNKGE